MINTRQEYLKLYDCGKIKSNWWEYLKPYNYLPKKKILSLNRKRFLKWYTWEQIIFIKNSYPTRHQLYGRLPPITKTIQVRRTRHAGPCWRSRDELISDLLLWTPTHGRAKAVRPARTYVQQLCEDTGCCPEDLSEAMNDREKWRERVRDIRATNTTWWWWWWLDGIIDYKWLSYVNWNYVINSKKRLTPTLNDTTVADMPYTQSTNQQTNQSTNQSLILQIIFVLIPNH